MMMLFRKVIDECDEDDGESDIYEDSEDDKPIVHFVDFEEEWDLGLDDGLLDKDDVHDMSQVATTHLIVIMNNPTLSKIYSCKIYSHYANMVNKFDSLYMLYKWNS